MIDTKVSVAPPESGLHPSHTRGDTIATNVLVSIVDDDESIRESLPDLVRSFGYEARAFASAEAFLASGTLGETSCLVLDIAMPGMSGPDLYAEVSGRGIRLPVIFITGNGNPELCEELVRQGAVACLAKPFDPSALIEAIRRAQRRES